MAERWKKNSYLSISVGPTQKQIIAHSFQRTAIGKRRSSEKKLQIIKHARLLTFWDEHSFGASFFY